MRERARGIRNALTHRDFRILWLGQTTGDLGDALGRIALAVLVFDDTASSLLTAAVFAVIVVPFLGPGQALTAWAERFPRRSVLVTADVLRAFCFAAIALPLPVGARFALLLLASLADPPFYSVRRALMTNTVPEESFGDAVTLTAFTTEACILFGAAAAGILTESIGPEGVLLLDAATFLISAMILSSLTIGRRPVGGSKPLATQLRDGWRAIATDPLVRRVSWLFPAASAGALGVEALLTPFVKEQMRRGGGTISWLAVATSVGVLLTAAILRPARDHRRTAVQAARLALLGGAIAGAAFTMDASLGSALAGYCAIGIVFAARVPTMVVLGQRLDDEVQASALSVVDGAYAVAQLTAALGAGAFAEATSPATACVVFATITAVIGMLAVARPARPAAQHAAAR